MKPRLQVTSDFTEEFNKVIQKFKNDSVLIGIPEDRSERKPENAKAHESPINNATILAINHFGVESRNIPARPVLLIGMRNCQDQLAEEMKKAASEALTRGWQAVDQYYNRAGIIGSNAVKKAINSQEGLKEPAESTLKRRKARGFPGTKTLIVTGQMRNAITYVVKGKP